ERRHENRRLLLAPRQPKASEAERRDRDHGEKEPAAFDREAEAAQHAPQRQIVAWARRELRALPDLERKTSAEGEDQPAGGRRRDQSCPQSPAGTLPTGDREQRHGGDRERLERQT